MPTAAIFSHQILHSLLLSEQGCQIFRDKINQNEGKYTKIPQHYQIAIKYTK
jgi:hypothetical protein